MWGAIIGDLVGSIYEYGQIKKISEIKLGESLLNEKSFYSDDTILTIAILEAILNQNDYDVVLKKYVKNYLDYHPDFEPYFKSGFSPSFIKWAVGDEQGKSIGNGAMMRISPVGYLFDSEEEVIK